MTEHATDAEHLRLLAIFHYVVGGMAAFFACFPLLHFFVGLAMMMGWFEGEDPAAGVVGGVFMGVSTLFILLGWIFAALLVVAGRSLSRRRHYTFCLVMAGVACLFMPFGTVLGVFTIIVLMRPSVKAMFQGQGAAAVESGA